MASEKRLIDANELLERLASSSETWAKDIQAIRNWWPHAVGIKDNIVAVIKEAPTVDAVEVVRCKNCKYYNIYRLECHNGRLNGVSGIDGYCSYGERREDNA